VKDFSKAPNWGRLLALPPNITLSRKCLPVTKTLTYYNGKNTNTIKYANRSIIAKNNLKYKLII